MLNHHDMESNPVCCKIVLNCISKAPESDPWVNLVSLGFLSKRAISATFHTGVPLLSPIFGIGPSSYFKEDFFDISITIRLSCLPFVYSASDIYPVKEQHQNCSQFSLARPWPQAYASHNREGRFGDGTLTSVVYPI